jgi:hypothetical protein
MYDVDVFFPNLTTSFIKKGIDLIINLHWGRMLLTA